MTKWLLDWDLEGNDNITSPWNHFTVPAQSYFDASTSLFDRSLLHDPSWKPGFPYHSLNAYAFIIAINME